MIKNHTNINLEIENIFIQIILKLLQSKYSFIFYMCDFPYHLFHLNKHTKALNSLTQRKSQMYQSLY